MEQPTPELAALIDDAIGEPIPDAYWLAQLIGALPIGIAVVLAHDLRVVAANAAMRRAIQFGETHMTGRVITELMPPEHALATRPLYEAAAQAGRGFEGEPLLIGGHRWLPFVRPVASITGDTRYLLIGLVDLGEAAPPDAFARLRELDAAKREFLQLAAHELRTPLAVITGYASLLAPGGLNAEHQQLAGRRIYEKARQLNRLISRLMQVARFDELGPEIPREPLDLLALLEELVAEVQRQAPDLAVALEPAAGPARVVGNASWLRTALQELLDNAIRFRSSPGRVDVSLQEERDSWRVTVADDGFGIDPADEARLFQRFSRIETDSNRNLVGLGIGLYLVREVALVHGGRAAVQSTPGIGSRFSMVLQKA